MLIQAWVFQGYLKTAESLITEKEKKAFSFLEMFVKLFYLSLS